jgi:hypothetical protein
VNFIQELLGNQLCVALFAILAVWALFGWGLTPIYEPQIDDGGYASRFGDSGLMRPFRPKYRIAWWLAAISIGPVGWLLYWLGIRNSPEDKKQLKAYLAG